MGYTENPQEFTYAGDLSEQPLPEVLFTIGLYKVPGVLTFTRKQVTKQIFIRDGHVVFAASNSWEDHLGEFLFRCGKISRVDLDQSVKMLSRSTGKREGDILIEMKAMRADELVWAVRSHQQAIVRSLFNWFDGSMKFEIGNFKESEIIQLDILIPKAILDGVRNIQQAKKIIGFLGDKSTILEQEENAGLALELFGGEEKEREILKRIDGKTTLYELCADSAYGPQETAKILYALLTLKLIRKRNEQIRIVSHAANKKF
jgi:Domain of unknown function (DUF4388)